MPDILFSEAEGVTVEAWLDPATGARPSRLNPEARIEHRRFVGATLTPIVAVFTRTDGSTDYDTPAFTAWLAEAPGPAAHWPTVAADGAGNRQGFTPTRAGHYTLVVRHENGGSIAVHFDVQ